MNTEQKKNLLNHANFMEKVITHKTNGLNMAVYYSTSPATVGRGFYSNEEPQHVDFASQDLTPVTENKGPCGFCACVIGWAAHNPDLPKPEDDEGWEEYAFRVFGCNNWDAGAYAFHAGLDIEQGADAAKRIRDMVAAYPRVLKISQDDWDDSYKGDVYSSYSQAFENDRLYSTFKE